MSNRSAGALIWVAAAGIAAAVPMACSGVIEPRQVLSTAMFALDAGTYQTPDGGSFDTDHDWGDMHPVDEPGYTGIDWPADQRLIDAERGANTALDGNGCMFGAHGDNPATNGGHTGVQALPGDTDQSICHTEYHPECAGKPLVLSVCYSGASGTGGFVSIASVMAQRCGVRPEDIVACTGPVYPGVPMLCDGTIVDGNGTPIGPQKIGGLDIKPAPPGGRGPPPGYVSRCPDCADGTCQDAGPDPYCGDGTCGSGEDCGSCSNDCGSCPMDAGSGSYCGDGTCDSGEDCGSCSNDCGSCMYDGGI